MLASLLTILFAAFVAPAWAQDDASTPVGEESEADPPPPTTAEEEAPVDDSLSPFRTPFPVLVERTIGTASQAVEFDWRRSKVQVATTGSHYFELNNFNSLRAGAMVRLPRETLIYEWGLSYVWVWDTPSSELLAYTPYRQPGRPQRMELDFTVGIPLAEGVVTVAPRWFPAVEMVFNAYANLRYSVYPTAYKGLLLREVAGAIVSPTLSDAEVENLETKRLDAMEVDVGRYGLMGGVGNDMYFRQGFFVSPRVMFAIPILAPASGTDLLFWADLSLSVGMAF
jgi:hypothetical protein